MIDQPVPVLICFDAALADRCKHTEKFDLVRERACMAQAESMHISDCMPRQEPFCAVHFDASSSTCDPLCMPHGVGPEAAMGIPWSPVSAWECSDTMSNSKASRDLVPFFLIHLACPC